MQPVANPATYSFSDNRDPRLWQLARRRAKFQGHLVVFALVNAGLWALWALLPEAHGRGELPWPIFATLFWGIAVVAQGLCAYSGLSRGERTQREYERLLSQQLA